MGFGRWCGLGFAWDARGHGMREDDVALLLLSLLEEGPRRGYELGLELEERSDGGLDPDPELVYPLLQSLVDRGWATVSGNEDDGKTYEASPEGRRELEENRARVERLWRRARNAGPERFAAELGCCGQEAERVVDEAVGSAIHSVRSALRTVDRALDDVLSEVFGSAGRRSRGRHRPGSEAADPEPGASS